MSTETRLSDRIDGLKIKVDGLLKERDAEALQRKDQNIPEGVPKLEEKVFEKLYEAMEGAELVAAECHASGLRDELRRLCDYLDEGDFGDK